MAPFEESLRKYQGADFSRMTVRTVSLVKSVVFGSIVLVSEFRKLMPKRKTFISFAMTASVGKRIRRSPKFRP